METVNATTSKTNVNQLTASIAASTLAATTREMASEIPPNNFQYRLVSCFSARTSTFFVSSIRYPTLPGKPDIKAGSRLK